LYDGDLCTASGFIPLCLCLGGEREFGIEGEMLLVQEEEARGEVGELLGEDEGILAGRTWSSDFVVILLGLLRG